MWFVSTIRLTSSRKVFRNSHFLQLKSVSAAVKLSSYDSSSDEVSDVEKIEKNDDQFAGLSSSSVIDMLNNLKNQPVPAVQFFTQLEKHGFKHDIRTYVALVRILCYWGMNRRLDDVLLQVIQSKGEHLGFDSSDLFDALVEELNVEGSNLLSQALEAMVKAFASVDMFKEASDTLFKTKMHGIEVSLLSCNYLMNQLVKREMLDSAVSIYWQLESLGLTPNVYTYGIVIKAFCRKGHFKEAEKVLFEKLDEAGVAPNNFSCNLYLEGLCSQGHSILGYDALRNLKEKNAPIDTYAYTVVLRGLVKEKKLKEAEAVLLDMDDHELRPDEYCYGALIRGYCQAGYVSKALYFHEEMMHRNVKTNCVITSLILQCLCQLGKFPDAVDQFKRFQKLGIYLDKFVYNIACDAFCKLGKTEEAVGLLKEMKVKGIVPDVVNYTTMINGCFLNGRSNAALELLDEMEQNGMRPDSVTYNVLAGECSRKGLVGEARDLLNYMKTQGIEQSHITFNIIIEGLCIAGKVKEAEKFFNSWEYKRPDNYAAMIDGYCVSNNSQQAYTLFMSHSRPRLLIKRNCCLKLLGVLLKEGEINKAWDLFHEVLLFSDDGPCRKMFAKMIAAFCRSGDMDNAKKLFDKLIFRGLAPDVIIYTIMLNGYCRVNRLDKAFALYKVMKDRGITPDIITYTVLLHGLGCRENRSAASSLLLEMKRLGLTGDVICYTVLIDSHCKSNNLQDAIEFYNEMIFDIGLEPDSVTCNVLLSLYFKIGEVEAAETLINWMSLNGMDVNNRYQRILRAKKVQFGHKS